ncbi:MAG: hypothetical protein RIB98_15185 [Acidimicrobiales bacterium]
MAVLAGLTGCGDDASPALGDLPTEPENASNDDATATGDQGSDPGANAVSGADTDDAELIVAVAGTEYVVDADVGGYCEIDDATATGSQVSAGGFDADSGTRVELSLRYQIGETTPSGEDEYYGGLFVASSPVEWTTSSNEPWPFEVADPISSTLTMEDDDGQLVEVVFEIDCS